MASDDQDHPCVPRTALCGAGGQGEASTGGAGNIREAGVAATSGEVCVVSIGSAGRGGDCEGRGGAGDTGGAAGDGGAGNGGGNILPSQPEPASLGQAISSLEALGSGEEQDEAGVGEGQGRHRCGARGEVAAGAE